MPVKLLVGDALPSQVISNQSVFPGESAIVPCTRKVPVNLLWYTAIVCSALLLFSPGYASMAPDVFASGPCADVKLDISTLATASGYAPSKTFFFWSS